LVLAIAVPVWAAPHSADTNGGFTLDLSEVLGAIQLYNAGTYQCDLETPGAYLPGDGDDSCAPHASDYAPVDRSVSLSELLRLLQLFNLGAYRVDCLGEDGYAPGAGEPVNCAGLFSDAALEAAVREAIGKPEGVLTEDDVAGLTELDASLRGVQTLDGMEACTDLVSLDLHGNCIADLAPLAGLAGLVSLNLHDNQVADVAPLSGLTALDWLWLGRNAIDDIAPLADNPGLASAEQQNHWDRINLTFNPLNHADTAAALAALESRGVYVWRNGADGGDKSGTADTTLRVHLRWQHGTVTLAGHAQYRGASPAPKRAAGRNGTLRITDTSGRHLDTAVDFDTTVTACNTEGHHHGDTGGESILSTVDRVYTLPLQYPLATIAYRPAGAESYSLLHEAQGADKGEACSPAEEPGDPVPISAKLIHGDPALPDERAYVLLLMGDAFVASHLGDPNLTTGLHNTSFIPYSQAMADSMLFLLSEEPFAEYATLFKIYRVDLISKDDEPTDLREDPPIVRNTALGMGLKSVGFEYDQALAYRVANNTGIAWDRIVLFPNGTGSGTQTGDFIVYSGLQNSRRMTALHEFGHGIGVLSDEYEYRHGTNPPAPLPPDDVTEPNAIARGTSIPAFEDIPWKHWIAPEQECVSPLHGEDVDFDCNTDENTECQCGPAPGSQAECVPLPTCEPGGDFIDVDGKIYGRSEWPEPADPASIIGLYEGAKYRQKGAYRAELRCRMRSDDDVYPGDPETPRFCTVCREALVMEFLARSGLAASETPDTGAPVFLASDAGLTPFEALPQIFPTPQHEVEVVAWSVNGLEQPEQDGLSFVLDAQTLEAGVAHSVTLTLRDNTPWVHPDFEAGQAAVTQEVTWTVTRAAE
jgi:hypothetical protein